MGIFKTKAPTGPDPETMRLQQEQEKRLAEQERKVAMREAETEEAERRRRQADVRRRRGFGGLLSGGFSGFKLSEKDTLG